ncbi:class I SAM-dependent DNA methyltransferase [Candidatus Pelagibacter sp. HIMB1593]|uniref:class I SAM-dependent DNA methyltransferase n=1 Tax=Candidatus Pelagibacter sp. HIMB1593 TaxID=3413355 RepID=UPI003F852596
MNKKVFDNYSNFYDIFYKNKDYISEKNYILNLFKKYKLKKNKLLEFGSGSGKHGRLLAKEGYSVHGIEKSKKMISLAEQGDGFTCEVGDICKLNLGKKFDAIFSLFHVMSYQTINSQINQVFKSANMHLIKNGLFIFDAWFTPGVNYQQPSVRYKRIKHENLEIYRIAEPKNITNSNIVDINYTILIKDTNNNSLETITEKHSMRHFSVPEIKFFAENNGFEHLNSEEFLTGKVPSKDTWTICNVFRKK